MRKYFLSFVALAAGLFATSCQESIVEPQIAGPTTFTVQLPNQMGTKAIGDAENVDKLYVAVYDEADLGATAIFKTKEDVVNGVAKVTLNLIQDQKYDIVFWAQKGESYVDENSELLSIPMKNTFHNSEEGAAFFHFEDEFTPNGTPKDITLRRPFAQLNLGTTSESLNTTLGAVTLSKSTIQVSSVATSFNTVTGVGEATAVTEGTYTADVTFDQELEVAGKKYVYVSMDYLPIVGDAQALVNITATIETSEGTIEHPFTNVPVRENYRTNIVGNLISSSTDFEITIEEEFVADYDEEGNVTMKVSTPEELQDAINNGVDNIILDGDIDLNQSLIFGVPPTSPIGRASATEAPSFVLDLNGRTISYTSDAAEHSAMITLKGGNLIIRDSQGGGKISYQYTGAGDPNFGWGTYTVANYGGTLVVDGGTIEICCDLNPDANGNNVHMYCALYQYSGTTIVNGGIISNDTYRSARLWKGDMNIKGGEFNGQLWVQAVDNSAKLDIAGGKFAPTGNDGSSVFVTNGTYDVSLNVSGGTFDTKIGCTDFTKEGVKGSVSGGIFGEQPNDNLIAEGYVALPDADGTYTVVESLSDESFADELSNLPEGKHTFTVSENIVLDKAITIQEGVELTLVLGDYTVANPDGYVFENSGILTISAEEGGISGLGGIRSKGGKVTINGGTYTASSDYNNGTFQHILKAENTVVEINEGNFDATIGGITNAMINVSENSIVTIKGGTFRNVAEGAVIPQFPRYMFTYEKNGKLIINDGDFYGGWRFNGETATTDIYGGTFTVSYDGQSFHANSTHVLTVFGGTFSLDNGAKLNPTNYVADGYKAIQDENNFYVVVPTDVNYVTPSNHTSLTLESNSIYYFRGDFTSSNVSLVMAIGVENVIFDGTDAININELIITQNGALIDNANTPKGDRSGNVTVQNFNVLSQINLFACKTEVVVQENSAEALMVHAGNCDVKVLNNNIDANFESHPTYRDANNTWNTNNYGIALNIFDYNLWLDGNTVTDALGHAIGINGWETTIDNGDENKIESFKNNDITVNSTTNTKRAAFKVWDDETYASNDDDTNVINPTAQAFINAVLADNSNTFNIIEGYDHTIFSFYNVNTNK